MRKRTVVEMARCTLNEKKLPNKFWAEAAHTAVYLQNRLPTAAVIGTTPIEAWRGVKPSAKHVKVFASICYVHVPAVKRSKLHQTSEIGIFLGYASMAKGYRIYNLNSHKIVISRDVVCDEGCYWDWEKKQVIHQTEGSQEAGTS